MNIVDTTALESCQRRKSGLTFSFSYTLALLHSDQQFCSTWGNYHFKTFDGGFLRLPSNCTYTFVRQCEESYDDFNIVIQRQQKLGVPVINAVVKLEGMIVELHQKFIKVDSKQ